MTRIRYRCAAALLGLSLLGPAVAFPVDGDQTVLPAKTELNEDALDKPREVFRSEITGGKSYLISLGDLAFNSPSILGGPARQANVSCGTCHVNGAGNAKFFMPKLSTRPGNFDTTGPLFNPRRTISCSTRCASRACAGRAICSPMAKTAAWPRCAISCVT